MNRLIIVMVIISCFLPSINNSEEKTDDSLFVGEPKKEDQPAEEKFEPFRFDGPQFEFNEDPINLDEKTDTIKGMPTKRQAKSIKLKEGWDEIVVKVKVAIPEEVSDEDQAKTIAKEAAISIGKTEIMTHIMKKETKSEKTLKEAQYPYVELQKRIFEMVDGSKVKRARWKNGFCTVTIGMDKSELKRILREN